MALLVSEENSDEFNSGTLWWWIMFWWEWHFCSLSGAVCLSGQQACWPPQMLMWTCLLPMHGFPSSPAALQSQEQNHQVYDRIGKIIKWKITLDRQSNHLRMFPVVVDLLWFEMLLIKVSLLPLLPQYLSVCLGFYVSFIFGLLGLMKSIQWCWLFSA